MISGAPTANENCGCLVVSQYDRASASYIVAASFAGEPGSLLGWRLSLHSTASYALVSAPMADAGLGRVVLFVRSGSA